MSRSRRERRRQQRRQAKTGTPSRHQGWWRPCAVCASAVGLAGLAYSGVFTNPFVYDDRLTVIANPSIRDLAQPLAILMHDIFRPVVNFSYAVDFARSGLDPAGYHLTNILLHMTNVALLFVVVFSLIRDLDATTDSGSGDPALKSVSAFAAASIFAVHPVMTEAVGYISGRSELLCTVFFLTGFLTLRAYLLSGERRWLVAGLAAFLLGVGSKETAAMLPFALVAYDVLVLDSDEGQRRRRLLRFHLPFAGIVTIAGLARVGIYLGVEKGPEAIGIWHNALTEVGVVWRYMWLLLAPVSQSIMHPVETVTSLAAPQAAFSILALIAAATALWFGRRRLPLVVLGSSWFLLLLAPAHVIPLQEAMAEHRVYTASCGLFLAVGAGSLRLLTRLQERGRPSLPVAWTILLAMLTVLTVTTVHRNRVWADPISLWADAAAKAPSTWGAHYAHGDALRAAGRCEAAVDAYQRAIELIPDQVSAHLNRGICLAELGRVDEAVAAFTAAGDIDPSNPQPHNNLATLAARLGHLDEAQAHFLEAIRLDPRNLRARLLLAQLNETAFDHPERALELCLEVLELDSSVGAASACVERNRARLR